jgi:hypothetical protein
MDLLEEGKQQIDLADPAIMKLAAPFKGAVLRVGGTAGNHFHFALPTGMIPNGRNNTADSLGWTLQTRSWNGLYQFAKQHEMRLVFQLNPYTRHPSELGTEWDSTNTAAFLKYIRDEGQHKEGVLVGFQFGNEPTLHNWTPDQTTGVVKPRQLSAAYSSLVRLMHETFGANKSGLLVQGPDSCCSPLDSPFLLDFLVRSHGSLDEVSVHYYPYSKHHDGCEMQRYITPADFDSSLSGLRTYVEIKDRLMMNKPLVLSESAGASCGGCGNVTNAFVGTLWFQAFLGEVSAMGYHQFYRQQLFGNNDYSLVSTTDKDAGPSGYHANPDYFLTILWRQLVGPAVLEASSNKGKLQRVYAACSQVGRPGAVAIVFANWASSHSSIEWQLSDQHQSSRRHVYILTSDSLHSRQVRLNGGDWLASASQLKPKVELRSSSPRLRVPAYSAGFIVLLDALAPACMS